MMKYVKLQVLYNKLKLLLLISNSILVSSTPTAKFEYYSYSAQSKSKYVKRIADNISYIPRSITNYTIRNNETSQNHLKNHTQNDFRRHIDRINQNSYSITYSDIYKRMIWKMLLSTCKCTSRAHTGKFQIVYNPLKVETVYNYKIILILERITYV